MMISGMRSAPDLEVRIVDESSPAAVRRAVRRLLGPVSDEPIGHAAVLVTSELVTNVVCHTLGGGWCSVWWVPDVMVRVEVEDTDPSLPSLPSVPTVTQLSGRGLHVVDTLAARWGMHRTERGKAVWCELEVPHA